MTTTTSLKAEVMSVLDQLPHDRLAEVFDFALFVKTRAQHKDVRHLITAVPVENLNALKGIVALVGDAVEDTERLYDGKD